MTAQHRCRTCRLLRDDSEFEYTVGKLTRRRRRALSCSSCRAQAGILPKTVFGDPPTMARMGCKTHTLKRYGLTPASYLALWYAQAGRCGVCDGVLTLDANTRIDHCRASGRVRGLLCARCRDFAFILEDGLPQLRGALAYLNPLP